MHPRKALAETHREWVFEAMCTHIRTKGYCPTLPEMSEMIGISPSCISLHISALVEAGRVVKHNRYTRSWSVPGVSPPPQPEPVPVFCDRCGMLAKLERNAHGQWLCQYCDGTKPGYYWHRVADSAGFAGKSPTRGKINGV